MWISIYFVFTNIIYYQFHLTVLTNKLYLIKNNHYSTEVDSKVLKINQIPRLQNLVLFLQHFQIVSPKNRRILNTI